ERKTHRFGLRGVPSGCIGTQYVEPPFGRQYAMAKHFGLLFAILFLLLTNRLYAGQNEKPGLPPGSDAPIFMGWDSYARDTREICVKYQGTDDQAHPPPLPRQTPGASA